MAIRNELLTKGGAAAGGIGATYTGGVFITGVNQELSSGGSFDLCITTGQNQIVMDSPIINSNSGDLSFLAFEDSVFTGGTSVDSYLNDRNSNIAPDIQSLVLNPVVTSDGVKIMPEVKTQGDNSQGGARSFLLGYPLILKPMTAYILRVSHNDGQTRQVNLYVAAYRRRDL